MTTANVTLTKIDTTAGNYIIKIDYEEEDNISSCKRIEPEGDCSNNPTTHKAKKQAGQRMEEYSKSKTTVGSRGKKVSRD